MAGTPNLQVEWESDDKNHKTYGFLGYPILRHTELELFDLCAKAAGTSFGNSGLWPCAIWTSPCSMEVAKSLASYTPKLGFWNIRDVPKRKLGRSCTESH